MGQGSSGLQPGSGFAIAMLGKINMAKEKPTNNNNLKFFIILF